MPLESERGARRQVEAYLCEAFALWTLHKCDVWIRLVKVRWGIWGIAGDIGVELVGGLVWGGKGDGRRVRGNISGTSKGVHEGRGASVLGGGGGLGVREERRY